MKKGIQKFIRTTQRTATVLSVVLLLVMPLLTAQAFEAGPINVHGFVSQGYLKTSDNNFMAETEDGTPEFNEIGLNFSTNLTNRLHIGMQVFAYTLGDEGKDEVNFDWAFADYRWRNQSGLRLGKMKLISGLYGERRQLDMLRTGIMLPFSVYLGPWWESISSFKGATLYGELSSETLGTLSYTMQGGVGNMTEDTGLARALEGALSMLDLSIAEMDAEYLYNAALQWETPLYGLRFKGTFFSLVDSVFTGDIAIPGVPSAPGMPPVRASMEYEMPRMHNYILSAEYSWRDFVFSTEFSENRMESRWNTGSGWEDRPDSVSQGWYLAGAYRVTDWFEFGAWYSEFYPNKDDKDGENQLQDDFRAWLKSITLSARFDINEYWICKLEASHNDGFGTFDVMNNDSPERYWWLYSAKVTFSF